MSDTTPEKKIHFQRNGYNYVLEGKQLDKAYESGIIALPDGTIIQIKGWLESFPPQPIWEEAVELDAGQARPAHHLYRVTHSPFDEDTGLPWEYDEDGFVMWVDEVFLEGYKHDGKASDPFPTVQECLDLLAGNGYQVEVVEEE